ncbi:hypothetical protein [Nonomuraea sp. NPDC050643]|uniref:hypothetical protein n=1 Tax=Nonomuraea sp. NPDC050643 TaxID=3155660 RepID=UPI0033E0C30A
MGVRRAPLLLAAALLAAMAAGPAAAEPDPWPVPRISVRPPEPPKGVTVGPRVRVPRVSVQSSPVPRVSIAMPKRKRRATPKVTVPHVTVYPDGVCTGEVQVGECPRRAPRTVHRAVPPAGPVLVPAPAPAPAPSPEPTPEEPTPKATVRGQAKRLEPRPRRRNPMTSVALTVVLVTAITSTTAVAFKARR